jgi:tetratricopeptide (TPR) repeat protein
MKPNALTACLLLTTPFLASTSLAQDALGLDDVKAIVAELEQVSPPNPDFVYPITVQIQEDATINAGAGYFTYTGDDTKYALVQVNTGMLGAPGLTAPHLRAILAHELAHMALGHAMHKIAEGDTQHALTRQQELEADRVGADYLVALGHERGEMASAILWIGRGADNQSMPWLVSVGGDHASPVMRAALLDPNDADLEAVALFEHGLMYLECGQHRAALPFFDLALEKQPELYEARLMAARAALQDYYERLPLKVQDAWLRPDFGPMLTSAKLLAGRSTNVSDDDRRRYQIARKRIGAIPLGIYPWLQMYLNATAEVLNPDGDVAVLESGVSSLQVLHSLELMQQTGGVEEIAVIRQRYANNLALGLQRLGRAGEARSLLLSEMAPRQSYVMALSGNLGHLPLVGLGEEQANLAIDLLVYFLQNTPPTATAYKQAKETLTALLESSGRRLTTEIASPEVSFRGAIEARVAGKDVGLFDPARRLTELLGAPSEELRPIEKYPDMGKLLWGESAEVLAIVERGRIVRLSTKRPGDAILLRPTSDAVTGNFEVRVGMTKAELSSLLDPAGDGGVFKQLTFLAGPNLFELWTYYPGLNFGVLLEDGLVKGVTVTPVQG